MVSSSDAAKISKKVYVACGRSRLKPTHQLTALSPACLTRSLADPVPTTSQSWGSTGHGEPRGQLERRRKRPCASAAYGHHLRGGWSGAERRDRGRARHEQRGGPRRTREPCTGPSPIEVGRRCARVAFRRQLWNRPVGALGGPGRLVRTAGSTGTATAGHRRDGTCGQAGGSDLMESTVKTQAFPP